MDRVLYGILALLVAMAIGLYTYFFWRDGLFPAIVVTLLFLYGIGTIVERTMEKYL